eukprot:gene34406-44448_t
MVATFILRAVDALITDLAIPSPYERTIFIRLLQSTNIVLNNLFGSETIVMGAAFNEILLPNECIEVTQLLACKNFEQWSVDAAQAFSKETFEENNTIESIELSANGTFVQSQRGSVRCRVSLNNIYGLLLTSAVERFNNVVGQDNLFKRSLVLIKLWIFNESKRLSYLDLSELFRHDVLVVITMMIFATGLKSSYYVLLQEAAEAEAQREIDHPLTALICFLEIFSEIDWTASRVSATGV